MSCSCIISWTIKRFCLPSRNTTSCMMPALFLLLSVAELRNMHFARLDDRPSTGPIRHLPPVQRSLIALATIFTRGVPMHIPLIVCPKHFPRLMHRDNVRVVRAFRSAEMVQRMTGWVALFKISRPAMRTSSAAGCEGAGFFEERDEKRFYGWEAGGYNADVHFDDLPDVCYQSSLAITGCEFRCLWDVLKGNIQYHEPSPVKSCTSKKWYCIGVL